MNRAELQEKEKYWIAKLDATNPDIGYNVSVGGDGTGAGWDNHQAKLNKDQLFELYDLLLNSTLTMEELGQRYGLDKMSISRINSGRHYCQEGFDYPLRKARIEKYELENKHDAFYGREEELYELIKELKDGITPIKDLQIKYKIGSSTISLINQGKKYYNSTFSYPLRKGGSSKVATRIFTEDEMSTIKKLLEENKISMTEIGKIIKCDRKVIAAINNGERQKQENWSYPLRSTPMKTGPKSS